MRTAHSYKMVLSLCSICFVSLIIWGCSDRNPQNAPAVIAKINEYDLPLEEFEAKLAKEMEFNRQYKTTIAAKKDFLDSLIKKELLIQKAMDRGIDKKEDFIQTIEAYWEATLIKTLIQEKTKEIDSRVSVSQEEITRRYMKLKEKNSSLPAVEQIEKQIAKEIKDEKKTDLMDQWLTKLHQKADIQINKQHL